MTTAAVHQNTFALRDLLRAAWWRSTPAIVKYSLALALVALALGMKTLIDSSVDQTVSPFLLMFFPVFVAALYGGLGPAVLAGVSGAWLTQYFFVPPERSLSFDFDEFVRVVIFAAEAVLLGMVTEAYHRREQAQHSVTDALRESESRFAQAVHANPAAISVTRASDRRIVDVNQAFLDTLGYEREEVVGQLVDDLGIWASTEERERFADAIAQRDRPRELENRVRAQSGEIKDVLGSAEVIQVSGEAHVLALFVDVTARKRAEDALRDSEVRYRELVEGLGVAVYTTDADGRITLFNDAAVELWGRAPVLGQDLWCGSWRLYWPDGRRMHHEECPMAITLRENRAVRGGEAIAERPDGTRVSFVPYPTPIRDASGKLVGGVNVLVDISERKRVEEQRESLLARVEAQQKRMDELVADVPGVVWEAWGKPDEATQRIDYVSEHVEPMLGYSREEWLATPNFWLTVVHPDDKERAAAESAAIFEGGEGGINEFRWVAKNGRVFWVEASSTVITDETGAPVGMRGVTLDISVRRQAEEALRDSEERFKATVWQSKVGVVQYDVDGRFVLVNQAFCDIVGRNEEELLSGLSMRDVTHPDDLARSTELFEHFIAGGPDFEIEKRYVRPDGSVVWVSKSIAAVRDWSGSLRFVVGFVLDITERRRIAEQLEFHRALLEAQTEAAIEGMIATTAEGRLLSHNNRFLELWGLSADTLTQDADALAARIRDQLENPEEMGNIVEFAQNNPQDEVSIELRLKDGRTFDVYGAPLSASSGASFGRVWFMRDMTERQRIQDELRRASEAKDEFLGLMSHELRTPLSTIFGGARLLRAREAELDQETKTQLLADIEEESERLQRIVEDLLALARVQLGERAAVEPVLAQRIVQRVVETFRRRNPARPIELDAPGDISAVAADPTYVEQIVRNLLTNAIKYSPAESPVEVLIERNGPGEIKLRVLDRGSGLSLEEAEQIFDRFYRAPSTAKAARGLGMGLTVSKRLVEALSGTIWATARTGGGLEVGFTLPIYEEDGNDAHTTTRAGS